MSNKKYVEQSHLEIVCDLFAQAIYNWFEVPVESFYYLSNIFKKLNEVEFEKFMISIFEGSFIELILILQEEVNDLKDKKWKCFQPEKFTRKDYKDKALKEFTEKVVINTITNYLIGVFKEINKGFQRNDIYIFGTDNPILKLSVFLET